MGPDPGYLEIDLVAHGGGNMAGSFIQTLAVTDVATGWVEAIPLLAREQTLVTEALGVISGRLPVSILGVDLRQRQRVHLPDPDRLLPAARGPEFTRSRAYRSNDQAYIELKNGAVVRWVRRLRALRRPDRRPGPGQVVCLCRPLHQLLPTVLQTDLQAAPWGQDPKALRPSANSCQRLLAHPAVAETVKEWLRATRSRLDPLFLLSEIRAAQSALATLAAPRRTQQGAKG